MHTTKTALQLQRVLMPKGYSNATRRRSWRRKFRAVCAACDHTGLKPDTQMYDRMLEAAGSKLVVFRRS